MKLKLLLFLSSRTGEEMNAVVTGVESFGLFVQGLEMPAEGLVSLESLPDDSYRFERTSHTLIGRRAGNSFRLGDRVRVTVFRVDLDRRTLDFRLVEVGGRVARGGGRAPHSSNKTKNKTKSKTNNKTKNNNTAENKTKNTSRGKSSRSQASGKSGKRAGKKRRNR